MVVRGSASVRLSYIGALCIVAAVTFTAYVGVLVTSRNDVPLSGVKPVYTPSTVLARLSRRKELKLGHETSNIDPALTVHSTIGAQGAKSPATSVISIARPPNNPRRFHIVTSAAGFPNHWQVRIHYWWYKKQKDACEQLPSCDMGGFTRLLHTGTADDLMDEVPTVVVDPLPKSAFAGKDSGYIVLNRPWAFVEWLNKASVPERFILMCESDHLFLRPLPNMMRGDIPAAAFFSYMTPTRYPDIVRSLLGDISDEDIKSIPSIGNSPTYLTVKDFRRLAPLWYNTTMQIWTDDKAHNAWNWILEMYGFCLATYKAGLHKGLYQSYDLMAQPPWDAAETAFNGQPYHILHLTYPMKYNSSGHFVENEKDATYVLDKRKFIEAPPPRNLPTPPSYVKNPLVRLAVEMINEATNSIPCWDEYHNNLLVTTECHPSQSAVSDSQQKADQA